MRAGLGPVEIQQKVRGAVQDGGRFREARGDPYEAGQGQPGGHPIEVAEGPLEAAKQGKHGEFGGMLGLFERDLCPDSSQG